MTSAARRPLSVWLALAFLAISALLHTLTLIKLTDYLINSGSDGIINFFIGLGFTGMVIGTMFGIFNRSSWGLRVAVLCFILMSLSAFVNIPTLLNWPDKSTNEWLFSISFLIARVLISFTFAIVFGFSATVKRYFGHDVNADIAGPPPPPTFDE